MIRDLLLLAAIVALANGARSYLPADATVTGSGATLALGIVLLAALFVGRVFHRLRLPHLTGFLLCGAALGPEVAGVLTPAMLGDLTLVKRVAVGLIALVAGCELNLRAIAPRARVIGAQTFGGMGLAAVLLFGVFWAILPLLPPTAGLAGWQRGVVALVLTNVACALSPAVVIALLTETRSSGPLSETALAMVVLADLAIVVTFTGSSALAEAAFAGGAGAGAAFWALALHIGGSVLAGVVLGAVLAVYHRHVGRRMALFVFAALFVAAEAGGPLHLDPLLLGLVAGLFLENWSPVSGSEVVRDTEPATVPVFAVFFGVVGAEIHVDAFVAFAGFALLVAGVRAAGMTVGARLGARAAGVDPALARLVPFGMLPQAGIALALANLLAQSPQPWARGLAPLVFGVIVVNELAGPVLFRMALARSGEIGARDRDPVTEDTAEAVAT
ncbi:MAG: cation:proton antiporter [Myxococcota bacterium]